MTRLAIGNSFLAFRLQVNHIATAQMAILLLPLLLRTAAKGTTPHVVFVSSGAHRHSPPLKPSTSDQGILNWLNDDSGWVEKSLSVPMPLTFLNPQGYNEVTLSVNKTPEPLFR